MELFKSGTAIADASGKATITLQPLQAFHSWRIKRMTIHSSSTLVPTVKVYRGGEAKERLVDGSYTGTLDHSDTDLPLRNGEPILFVFEGATVGASCSAIIEGEEIVR